MALNVNIIGKDSEGNLRALKVNSEGNLDFGQLETEIQAVKDNQGRLYGKYGETWIPVKVDSEGRPIIASDVTVNMEGLVIDVGEQLDLADRPNRELGKVSLSGTIRTIKDNESLFIPQGGMWESEPIVCYAKEVGLAVVTNSTGASGRADVKIQYMQTTTETTRNAPWQLVGKKTEGFMLTVRFPLSFPIFRLRIENKKADGGELPLRHVLLAEYF